MEFAFVEGSVFLWLLVGPAAAAALGARCGDAAAFLLAAALALVSLALTLKMDETRPPVPKRAAPWVDLTPLAALRYFAAPGRRLVGGACLAHWLGMRGEEFLLALVADRGRPR